MVTTIFFTQPRVSALKTTVCLTLRTLCRRIEKVQMFLCLVADERIRRGSRWRWCHGSFMWFHYGDQLRIPPTLRFTIRSGKRNREKHLVIRAKPCSGNEALICDGKHTLMPAWKSTQLHDHHDSLSSQPQIWFVSAQAALKHHS